MVDSPGAMLVTGVPVAGRSVRSASGSILSAPSTRTLSCCLFIRRLLWSFHQGQCLYLWYRWRVGRYGETVALPCQRPRPGLFPVVYSYVACYGRFTRGNACTCGIGGGSAGTEKQWLYPASALDPNSFLLFPHLPRTKSRYGLAPSNQRIGFAPSGGGRQYTGIQKRLICPCSV
jgi:hypothetical protein